jgi:hypothetical protein
MSKNILKGREREISRELQLKFSTWLELPRKVWNRENTFFPKLSAHDKLKIFLDRR